LQAHLIIEAVNTRLQEMLKEAPVFYGKTIRSRIWTKSICLGDTHRARIVNIEELK
jgi:hypothetical protein